MSNTNAKDQRGVERSTLVLTTALLEDARRFFETRGALGCEGTALLGGTARADGTHLAETLVIPDQVAAPAPHASVTVTPVGDIELITALCVDQRYLARIHSHPGLAFHSKTDDDNPALTHSGAISIVVPFFGLGLRHGLDACAVYVRLGNKWQELPPNEPARSEWVIVDA